MSVQKTSFLWEPEEFQIAILALAELSLSRPGWEDMIRRMVGKLGPVAIDQYERLRLVEADRVKAERGPLHRRVLEEMPGNPDGEGIGTRKTR